MATLHLLFVFLIIDRSLAGLRASPSAVSTQIQRTRNESSTSACGQFSVASALHQSQIGSFGLTKTRYHHESSTSASNEYNTPNSFESVLSIRGGASSTTTNNAVQSVVKSILACSSIPSPIKQLIEMVCQFIESLTGFKVLPRAGKKKNSKSIKTKTKEKELLREAVTVGKRKRNRSKSIDDDMEDNDGVVQLVRKEQKGNRKSESAADVGETITSTTKPETASTKKSKPTRPDAASKKFLSNNLKSSNPNYRIQRELKEFLSSPPPGLSVKISGKNVRLWIITLSMPDNTIYAGETYKLRVQFPNDYPTSPPSVYFLPPTPRHEHVYTNGDICLSLLGTDWRPIMTAQSIAQAIMSILCGAQRKSLPMDNARHAGNKPGLKQDDWVYHDDNC
ncbi:hypothetical protein ACHAXH_000320 [Discostella pseudostelligera]